MIRETLEKLELLRVTSMTSASRKDMWTKDLALFYLNLMDGNEKGIYGMVDDTTGKVEYVGEAIDMTWRMYEHFHQVRGANGKSHNIGDSFYKHHVPVEDITFETAIDFLSDARKKYTPVCLWAQEDDGPEGNAARWVAEHEMIIKYQPSLNYNLVLPIVATKRSANRFTNENGRYE